MRKENKLEDSKTNSNRDSNNEKKRDDFIESEIGISNAYLQSINDQDEKITDNLLKISIFLSFMIITMSQLMLFLTRGAVKVEIKNNDDTLNFAFLYFTYVNSGKQSIYSIFCIEDECNSSCNGVDFNELMVKFNLKCENFTDFKKAGTNVNININKV